MPTSLDAVNHPTVVFYGDSIVTGWRGTTHPRARWSSLVSDELGWREMNLAVNAARPALALLSGGLTMATLTIRNLPEPTRRALKERAARHNRSMEAEVRDILVGAVDEGPDLVGGWLRTAERFRSLDGDDLVLPERPLPRPVDLT